MHYKILLLALFTTYCLCQFDKENKCVPNEDCGACLRADGSCNWCEDPAFPKLSPRCNTAAEFNKLTTKCNKFMSIQGSVSGGQDDDFTDIVQVRPQKISFEMRPSQTQTFQVKVQPAKNFPVNLYYLMDMSKSMEDDLEKLRTLGTDIAKKIEDITTNYKLGFGSFVDKTVAPFVQIEALNRPCDLNTGGPCAPTFGYRHNFNFSKSGEDFEKAVAAQKISGNLDTPEGGFDGLMQVTVCGSRLNWPPIKQARRIVVFVTDATPHIAGDGKLGGILVPNDALCHLDSSGLYTKSNTMDYPSISLMKAKLKENKIVPIFAVTGSVLDVYQKLTDEWKGDTGASIGKLETDSSNVVDLIEKSYRDITRTVRLTDNAPAGVNVRYKQTKCDDKEETNICKNVDDGETVEFDVDLTVVSCPKDEKDWTKPINFKITIPGFDDIDVEIKMICDCPCERASNGAAEENSAKCNGTGTYKCGICYCPPDRFGDVCQCDKTTSADTTQCKQPNSTTDVVCSGFGSCVCGKCVCNKRNIATEIISGTYCQCNNFGCDRFQGKICGGPDRGECECGKCKCKELYLGDNCGDVNCTLGRKNCEKDGNICSGHGKCECDRCNCDQGYNGQHCENCVSCPGKCSNAINCVLCQAFDKGSEEDCKNCNLNWKWVNETEERCVHQDDDGCYIIFNFEQDIEGNETVLVKREKRCIVVVKKDPPILAIVLGTIGGIVLLGLILLLLWKLIVTAYDNYEYHKFEKDRMKSKWENAENPIYRPSKQQFQNPAYAGAK